MKENAIKPAAVESAVAERRRPVDELPKVSKVSKPVRKQENRPAPGSVHA
jgi:hypothetical protein